MKVSDTIHKMKWNKWLIGGLILTGIQYFIMKSPLDKLFLYNGLVPHHIVESAASYSLGNGVWVLFDEIKYMPGEKILWFITVLRVLVFPNRTIFSLVYCFMLVGYYSQKWNMGSPLKKSH